MANLLYVTTSRADYWIMRKLLKELDSEIDLKILISGMHLSKKYGSTYKSVLTDFPNADIMKVNADRNNDKYQVIDIMSKLQTKFTNYLKKNKIDYLMLLGDRSEILPFAICAAMLNIPIIHLHGGEITLGAYDEFVRHSITMMSSLHLTATEQYKQNILNMGKSNVHNIGSLGCSNVHNFKINSFYKKYKNYIVILFHPETIKNDINQGKILLGTCQKLVDNGYKFVFLGGNNDVGGNTYINLIKEFCSKNNFDYFPSLSNDDFFSLLSYSKALVGNSSSGIIEVPCLCKPIINIGDRQLGRIRSNNIINIPCKEKDILKAIESLKDLKIKHSNPYCKNNTLKYATKLIVNFIRQN